MSPRLATSLEEATGFPRVSGDEPQHADKISVLDRFSPRERG